MQLAHEDYLVDLVDKNGNITGQKPRKDIDKTTDLTHWVVVLVLVLTPGKKLVLSKIPKRDDLPNLYADKLGMTVATIRRHNESNTEAATRALANEIYFSNPELTHLGDSFAVLSDGHRAYISAYYIISDAPTEFSKQDIDALEIVSPNQLDARISDNPGSIAPTLSFVWEAYRQQLPVG